MNREKLSSAPFQSGLGRTALTPVCQSLYRSDPTWAFVAVLHTRGMAVREPRHFKNIMDL